MSNTSVNKNNTMEKTYKDSTFLVYTQYNISLCMCLHSRMHHTVCMCMCVREGEREREREIT